MQTHFGHDDVSEARTSFARYWLLDPEITFLNHGSFGACPKPVLDAQQALREWMEREPITFLAREMERRLDEARAVLAAFVGANCEDLVFVPNTTHGVNTVLRSLSLRPGDEVLVTDHEYNACRMALDFAASVRGAIVVVARVGFPVRGVEQVSAAILERIGPRTRLALLDHITSPTAVIFPIAELVRTLAARGIDTLVDGAHAPGMLPLALDELGAAYFTGNCHKWLCAPKGAAFLHVRRDRQASIRPLAISHGANDPRTDRSRFWLEFDWTGTSDLTPYLCVPEAIRFMGSLLEGGWPALMRRNHQLACTARSVLCDSLSTPPACADTLLGSMATLLLPGKPLDSPVNVITNDPLGEVLYQQHRIEVPVMRFPGCARRLLRVSAQIYNTIDQYARLAAALQTIGGG
jgi:isopenicillin-N epimerase